jgi:murein L,D-transpeptidase YcbB/YkuD
MIAQYTLEDTTEPALVVSYLVDSTNQPLIERLYRLGYLDSPDHHLPEMFIRERLRKAQHLFEFFEDGGLRPDVFEALNVPLKERIGQLKQSLNVFRWLDAYRKSKQIIVVNIPAANLFCYRGDSILLASRTVVGKPATPTPTLSSTVRELIMYPYWTVPHSIANDINWKVLSTKNFPYTIRQANGCDNSLGIMKLNFFSPYDVYLHDTPWKNFFSYNRRYFSHGCMRVEEALALAKLVVPERAAEIDRLSDCKKSPAGKPVIMKLKDPVPVFVLYQVAWPDEKGMIRFFKDVYRK